MHYRNEIHVFRFRWLPMNACLDIYTYIYIFESVAPANCESLICVQAIKIANDINRLNASEYKNKHRFCIRDWNRLFDAA